MMTVYVLSYNAGVLGVYKSEQAAKRDKVDYESYNYVGVKLNKFRVHE
jgi:hypothetical protein